MTSFSATEWDFVEAPSQMLENWVYDYDTLSRFAVDPSGKRIPRALVTKMNRARYFSLGMDDLRQVGLANVSLQYFLRRAPTDELSRAVPSPPYCNAAPGVIALFYKKSRTAEGTITE